MFRKPKKVAGRTIQQQQQQQQKRKKKQTVSQSSFRSSQQRQQQNSDDDDDDTSELLESLRPSCKKRQKKSNNNNNNDKNSTTIQTTILPTASTQQQQQLTAQELATRTAEYHPINTTTTTTKAEDSKETTTTTVEDGTKIYKGENKVRNKFWAGPLKASSFVRTTCRFDYQPDICKDYKDTGFCGYGDTCIYLHDRGDTMTGWQLEQQWEEKKKKEQLQKEKEMNQFINGQTTQDETEEPNNNINNDVPFACFLCRDHFTNPIVTTCHHYFCESCILSHFQQQQQQQTKKCPICSKDTHGILNCPTKLETKKRKLVGSQGTWKEYYEKQQVSKK